jgi:putative ATP-binding cassette transporter
MSLFRFISRYAAHRWPIIILASLIAAVSQSSILVLANHGVHATGDLRLLLAIGFLCCCGFFVMATTSLVKGLTQIIEGALCQTRIRLAEKSCNINVDQLEKIGVTELYEPITQSSTIVSNAAFRLSILIQAILTVLFLLVYIIYHFNSVLLLLLICYLLALPIYRRFGQRSWRLLSDATLRRIALFNLTADLVHGAKEVRLCEDRRAALVKDFDDAAEALRKTQVDNHLSDQARYVFTNLTFFTMLGTVVFALPSFGGHDPDFLLDLSSALFFLLHPISQLNSGLPEYERANHSVERLNAIEAQLDAALTGEIAENAAPFGPRFVDLKLDSVVYQHCDETGQPSFAVGPVSFEVKAGEIVFLVGGNGSGKTTLFKVLTTLFKATSGEMRVNGVKVEEENRQAYREMLGAIFTDFHLFKKLYGQEGVEEERVNEWIEKLGLRGRTKYEKGEFSKLTLSTGQRKRLALAVALIEDRPMYFFDEWAADQDPEFRKYYYEELLPELKRKGKTVVAITHDDRYFGCADRVITLEYGSIRDIKAQTA